MRADTSKKDSVHVMLFRIRMTSMASRVSMLGCQAVSFANAPSEKDASTATSHQFGFVALAMSR